MIIDNLVLVLAKFMMGQHVRLLIDLIIFFLQLLPFLIYIRSKIQTKKSKSRKRFHFSMLLSCIINSKYRNIYVYQYSFLLKQVIQRMGGTPSKNKPRRPRKSTKNVTEMVDVNFFTEEYAEEQYIEITECCGMKFTKILKRKIIWENNLINNCNMIKQNFKWAGEIIELVQNNPQPKSPYLKEINDLKLQVPHDLEYQREIVISPSELEQFKMNIKKSVLVSCSQTSKYYQQSARMTTNIGVDGKKSRIDISKFKESTYHMSSNKKIQRSPSISSSKSGLRKSIMSFVDDTLSSVFGNQRQVSKQVAKKLQIFLKFSMIVEKHFNDSRCILSQLKRKFVDNMIKTYSDASQSVSKITQMIDSINQFTTILKEALIDYYNINSFGEGQITPNHFIANQQNLLSLCMTIIFKQKNFYQVVFNVCKKQNQQREEKFQKIIRLLENQSPSFFHVRQKFCLDQSTIESSYKGSSKSIEDFAISKEPYSECKMILNQLAYSKSPINKMKIIFMCSEMVNKQVEKFYDVNGLDREKWVLDADQVLSIFCYIIIGAKIKNLHTHLFMLDNFSTSSQMISMFGYYLSVMNCAIQQLQNDYEDKLDLSEPSL